MRNRPYSLVNAESSAVVVERAVLRRDFLGLLMGFMGKTPLAGFALGLAPCDQVHTFFVPCALDVAFCDVNGRILHITTLSPARISPRVRGAKTVWEARAGTLTTSVSIGDVLVLRQIS